MIDTEQTSKRDKHIMITPTMHGNTAVVEGITITLSVRSLLLFPALFRFFLVLLVGLDGMFISSVRSFPLSSLGAFIQ